MTPHIPQRIIIHHSATPDNGAGLSWSAIRYYHVETLGWEAIAYHCGIERVGNSVEALMGRPWDVVGAHCRGNNPGSLGLCFVGDWEAEMPDDERLTVGAELIKLWMRIFGIQADKIHKHSDFNDTRCPGGMFPFDNLIGMLR